MAVSPWDADGDAAAGEVSAADVCAAQPGADAAWKGAKDAGGALPGVVVRLAPLSDYEMLLSSPLEVAA